MNWTDEEVKEGANAAGNGLYPDFRAIMTRAVELVSERGGTETPRDIAAALVVAEEGVHQKNRTVAAETVRQHIATQGVTVAALQAEVGDAWLATKSGARGMVPLADVVGSIRAEAERLKVVLKANEVLVLRAGMLKYENHHLREDWTTTWRERAESAESRLAAIRTCLGEHDAEDGPDFVQTVAEVRSAMRCAKRAGRQRCPLPVGHDGACEQWPQPSAMAQHAPQGSKTHPEPWHPCVCGNSGAVVCHADRHPCSHTCTHDDAATPGHPQRVKERSEAAEEIGRHPKNDDHAFRIENGVEGTVPYTRTQIEAYAEKKAEDMRGSCVRAARDWAQQQGLSEHLLDSLKAAIEGAAP